mmetsp:Transcript_14813/g.22305  ORF Transcript_14813/g.22305 Transcript_14813/m.22305 type:complete len:142 (+) Transcript_14813:164-589(+)
MFANVFRGLTAINTSIRKTINLTPSLTVFTRGMANQRHKKMIKLAKGYRNRANRCFTVAKQRVQKARLYAYHDRKVKKREFRKLWIQRINAATRMYGMPYNMFINGMLKSDIRLNRKVLADLAVSEPLSFRSVVEVVKNPQ